MVIVEQGVVVGKKRGSHLRGPGRRAVWAALMVPTENSMALALLFVSIAAVRLSDEGRDKVNAKSSPQLHQLSSLTTSVGNFFILMQIAKFGMILGLRNWREPLQLPPARNLIHHDVFWQWPKHQASPPQQRSTCPKLKSRTISSPSLSESECPRNHAERTSRR